MKTTTFSKSFSDAYNIIRFYQKQGIRNLEDLKQCYFNNVLEGFGHWKDLDDSTKQQIYTDSVMFNKELDGQCVHFFVDNPYLKTFLKETEIKDFSFYKQMLYDNWKDDSMRGETFRFCFCLHFQNEIESPRYILTIQKNDISALEVVSFDSIKIKIYDSMILSDNKVAKRCCARNDDLKIGVNFLFYIQAFPEVVKDGIPKGYKTDNMRGKRQTVKLCNKICIEDSKSVTPHFRRGHFRYLGSEYYSKMRGKTIFIESTVVNSKNNKTVEKL